MGYGHPIHGIPMSWRLGGDGRNSRRRHSEETACKTTASEPWFSNTRVVWEFLGVKKLKVTFLGGGHRGGWNIHWFARKQGRYKG